MTLALRPARRYLVSNRRHTAPKNDITRLVRALTRLLSVAVAGLLVWIVILGVSLPTADATRQWKLLWIGFDSAEVAALGVTLWAVYRSRQLAIPAALITGTLFACDAWFDVVLSWGTHGWWPSLATAVLVELPLAALLWGSARSMVHAVIAHQMPQNLQSTNGPRLRQLELMPHEHPIEDRSAAPAVHDVQPTARVTLTEPIAAERANALGSRSIHLSQAQSTANGYRSTDLAAATTAATNGLWCVLGRLASDCAESAAVGP